MLFSISNHTGRRRLPAVDCAGPNPSANKDIQRLYRWCAQVARQVLTQTPKSHGGTSCPLSLPPPTIEVHVKVRLRLFSVLLLLTPQISFSQLRIHEVLYDGPGTDADDAFTEIVGSPGFSIDGWRLVGINGGNDEIYRDLDLTGAVIPADSILVTATSNAAGAALEERDFTANVDWQNGPDAVQLRDPIGTVIDAVQYGDAGEFNSGEGVSANSVSAGRSLSRDRSSSDSDDNAADFSPLNPPTPGSLSGNELRLSIPDTSAAYNDSLVVPLHLSVTSGRGILAAEVFVSFDGELLTADSAKMTTMSDGWTLVFNRVAGTDGPVDTLKIAMDSDADTLEGSGGLVAVHFSVSDHRRPTATAITIEHALFNDGSFESVLVDGQVSIIGNDAVLAILPAAPVAPPGDLIFELFDMDDDRDVLIADTLKIRVDGDSQVEVLTAVETGANTGFFRGSLPVVIGAARSNNGVLETVPGETLTLCHDDSLTAYGQTLERCVVGTVAAHDGQLSATAVAEPGDTLRIQLIDEDLNSDPTTIEVLELYAINSTSPDTERVALMEAGPNDSVFVAVLPTSAALAISGDSLVSVTGGDAIFITYDDEHRTSGDPATVLDTSFVVALFGDADGNGLLQAFDAAAVLSHVLSPSLAGIDSLAANVDSSAPEGAITPFDAASFSSTAWE